MHTITLSSFVSSPRSGAAHLHDGCHSVMSLLCRATRLVQTVFYKDGALCDVRLTFVLALRQVVRDCTVLLSLINRDKCVLSRTVIIHQTCVVDQSWQFDSFVCPTLATAENSVATFQRLVHTIRLQRRQQTISRWSFPIPKEVLARHARVF